MTRAVCIGECMVELRGASGGLFGLGYAGDAYNTAVYLKRSAPQAEVAFLTATGEGSMSAAMRATWAEHGISDRLAFALPGTEPGLYVIELDEAGDRTFHYWRSASPARRWLSQLVEAGGAEVLAGVDMVFLSGLSMAILEPADRIAAGELIASLRGRVGRIAFDTNIRPSLWGGDPVTARAALAPLIAGADIVRASRDDAAWLFGATTPADQAAALHAAGARELALTLDAQGCALSQGGELICLPAPPTEVRDTSGAGDSFNGGYLAARMAGASPREAALAGLTVASRVVTWPGAIAPVTVSHPQRP